MLKLTLALAVALAAAAPAVAACPVGRDGACLKAGLACGPSSEHGRCETTKHRIWRGVRYGCECQIKTPHGYVVAP